MLRLLIVFGTIALGSCGVTFRGSSPAPLPAAPKPKAAEIQYDVYNITFVISGKDLPSKLTDVVDPYVKVYETSKTIIEPFKFGTTEVVDDNPNPQFNTVLSFQWKRGTQQKLKFKLKDSDRFRDNDIGEGELDVDTFVLNGFKSNVTLSNGGSLIIQKTTPTKFRLYARNLPKMDPAGGKSDPYVKCFWRRGPKGEEIKFYTTAVVNDVENADWNETIEFPNYVKGQDLWWVFKVLDSDGIGKDDNLGEALVEIDPFVEKRQTKIVRLGKDGQATLAITPA